MMAANYRHIGGSENRLGRHYSRFSRIWPTAFVADQPLALRKSQNGGSNRRRRANWHEPGLNRSYLDLATHYGTAILPARPRKPRDKAKVEVGVLVVERWILARLRNRRFFALAELNQAIGELVADLNARPMRRLGVTRCDLFLELDRPALKPLPAEPYEYAEWRLR